MEETARSFVGMAIGITAVFLVACAPSEPSNGGLGRTVGGCLDDRMCDTGLICDSSGRCVEAPSGCVGAQCGDGTATAGLFLDGFFPIAWFIPYPDDMPSIVARGFNTAAIIGDMDEYSDREWDEAAAAAGMKTIRHPIGDLATDATKPHLLAWAHPDEPDYCTDCTSPPWLDYDLVESIEANYATWKAVAPQIPVYTNFGGSDMLDGDPYGCNGPGDTDGEETDLQCYPRLIAAADWIGNDVYPVNGYLNHESWRYDISIVGQAMDKAAGLSHAIDPGWSDDWVGSKPQFPYIEGSQFETRHDGNFSNRGATPAEVRAEMWNGIIHGARGLFFFSVVLTPGWSWDGMTPAVSAEVTSQNATITALSNVLQDVINPTSISATMSSSQLEAGWRDTPSGRYFFVLNTLGTVANGVTVTLNGSGMDAEASATVYDEARSETLTPNGKDSATLVDDFAAFARHIYVVN